MIFLSTLSLRRATRGISSGSAETANFYPRSPCGERREPTAFRTPHQRFLSTLSLRRATKCLRALVFTKPISIHALLAESDLTSVVNSTGTMDFYPRSPCGERLKLFTKRFRDTLISIHALLAESDSMRIDMDNNFGGFLSTLSLRRATIGLMLVVFLVMNFYPRSPCGERLVYLDAVRVP